MDRASYRYEPAPDHNAQLREELLKLARQKLRYGYRRLHAILERRGHQVNVKRVYRLYSEEGLAVRRRKRKRLVRERAERPRLVRPNEEWAIDFIVDGLANGRMVRILSVIDAFTRECLALEADTSLGTRRVTRVLDRLIAERGKPSSVRSDNGPEFTSRRMLGWAEERKISLVHIQPGRPMQNGHVESFHGRLRDECLNASWFRTLNDVRQTLEAWRQDYNCERPHSSLGYKTPREFAASMGFLWAMEMWKAKNASHISTAPTTATRYTRGQTKTGKLQLSVVEKNGAGQDHPVASRRWIRHRSRHQRVRRQCRRCRGGKPCHSRSA